MSKYVKYILLSIFLAVQSPPLLAETNDLTKVRTDYQSKAYPFWNCDCSVEKYQQARETIKSKSSVRKRKWKKLSSRLSGF